MRKYVFYIWDVILILLYHYFSQYLCSFLNAMPVTYIALLSATLSLLEKPYIIKLHSLNSIPSTSFQSVSQLFSEDSLVDLLSNALLAPFRMYFSVIVNHFLICRNEALLRSRRILTKHEQQVHGAFNPHVYDEIKNCMHATLISVHREGLSGLLQDLVLLFGPPLV